MPTGSAPWAPQEPDRRNGARYNTRMKAWRGWYHVSGSTYGTWLRGDPRGWRARRHREHVNGDYKNPPPQGTNDDLHKLSKRLLKSPPVRLSPGQQRIAVEALIEKLTELEIVVLAASVDAVHYHLLGRFGDGRVRGPVGRAKQHAWHLLNRQQLAGRAWAKKCRAPPIADRQHQVNAFNYIVSHKEAGACVWTFREGIVQPKGG